jgi:hypothetical protein
MPIYSLKGCPRLPSSTFAPVSTFAPLPVEIAGEGGLLEYEASWRFSHVSVSYLNCNLYILVPMNGNSRTFTLPIPRFSHIRWTELWRSLLWTFSPRMDVKKMNFVFKFKFPCHLCSIFVILWSVDKSKTIYGRIWSCVVAKPESFLKGNGNTLYRASSRMDGTDLPAPMHRLRLVPRAPHPHLVSCCSRLAPRTSCPDSHCAQPRSDLCTVASSSVPASSSASTSVHWRQQVYEHMLQSYVSCVSDICCISFIWMLQK